MRGNGLLGASVVVCLILVLTDRISAQDYDSFKDNEWELSPPAMYEGMNEDKRQKLYSFGLGKRYSNGQAVSRFRFGLGKRADSLNAEVVKREVEESDHRVKREAIEEEPLEKKSEASRFSFGLGKRENEDMDDLYEIEAPMVRSPYNSYRFGLGKREEDNDEYEDFHVYVKRPRSNSGKQQRNIYSFGLGKRANNRMFNFGLGKRPSHLYSFGLGKRAKTYSFGLGKRRNYSFGLGKKSGTYNFGLGKRATEDDITKSVDDDNGLIKT